MDEQRVDVDWANSKAVVSAAEPAAYVRKCEGGWYVITNAITGNDISSTCRTKAAAWRKARRVHHKVLRFEAQHNPSKRTTPGERQGREVAERYQAHGGAIFIPRMVDYKNRLVGSPAPSYATLNPARSHESVTPAPAEHPAPRDRHAIAIGERYQAHSGAIYVPYAFGDPIWYTSSDHEGLQSASREWWIANVHPHAVMAEAASADHFVDANKMVRADDLEELEAQLRVERYKNAALRESLAILKRDADRGFRDLQATLAAMIAAKGKEVQS